jgi:exo-beta-1,3-glucanase (GH17 family)
MPTHSGCAVILASLLLLVGVVDTAGADDTVNTNARTPSQLRSFVSTCDGSWIGNAIAYSPYRDGQRPGGPRPTRAQLAEDLTILDRHWHMLRTYAADDATADLIDTIATRGLPMKVVVGAWIAPERDTTRADGSARSAQDAVDANRQQVTRAIALANQHPDIVIAVSVGNETQVSWSAHRVAPDILLDYIRQVRRETSVPVTTADDYTFWLEPRSKPIAAAVDFIGTHIHAMWRGQQLADAVVFMQREYDAVQAAHPHHQIVIGEAGWATQKHTEGDQARYIQGQPGVVEQKRFYDAYLAWTTRERIVNFYFEAFDEKWKGGPHPDEVEKHWGLYRSDRQPKLALRSRMGIASADWRQRVCNAAWICYTPSQCDPGQGVYPPPDAVRADLAALRDAGFSGLITYGCKHPSLRAVVPIAAELGFRGIIVGIWNPLDEEECAEAQNLADHDIVLGLCVGNEGLGSRYAYNELILAIDRLRTATGKPTTTTEEIADYFEPHVLYAGDWVFPNAHPLYHGRNALRPAIRWTAGACADLRRRADRFVWLKEVGFPSGGGADFSAANQQAYYEAIAAQDVTFAYFEAFDQPWKQWRDCEPHFGLFDATRTPKPLAEALRESGPPTLRCPPTPPPTTQPATTSTERRPRAYVYRDHDSAENRFSPTGRQGDAGDVHVDAAWRENVHSGTSCLRVRLDAQGAGPHRCDYGPPCRWAGLRWLHPEHNWGRTPESAGLGLDLRGAARLVFWARVEAPSTVSFMVGGVDSLHGDSLAYPARTICRLDDTWRRYTIDLSGCDLRHIIAGFGCSTSWDSNPEGVTLYLDEIYFE